MGIFLAFIAGWVFGSQSGKEEYDDVVAAAIAIRDSDEFATLISAVRLHAGHVLRSTADWLQEPPAERDGSDREDLLARVRSMVRPTRS